MQWSPTTSIIVVDAKSLTFLRLLALGLVLRPTDEYAAAATFASNPSRKRGGGAGFANRLAAHREFFVFVARPEHETVCLENRDRFIRSHPALLRAETIRRRVGHPFHSPQACERGGFWRTIPPSFSAPISQPWTGPVLVLPVRIAAGRASKTRRMPSALC